jgi:F-type H+-transporting ATPase subunit b
MTALPRRVGRTALAALLAGFLLCLTAPRVIAAEHQTATAPAHNTTSTTAVPANEGHTVTAANADHKTAGDHKAGGHEEHDPKLIPDPGALQIITTVTTLVIFLALLYILSKYAWGPIVSGLKAREDKIRKDIKDAEEARLRADKTLKEYQAQLATAQKQIQDLLAKASADAQTLATSIRMNAQQEAEEAKERNEREIEASKNQAIAEIYEQAANLATTLAEKILRRNLNADDQRELVRSSIEQLKGVNAN